MSDKEILDNYLTEKKKKRELEELKKLKEDAKWDNRIYNFTKFLHVFGIHTYKDAYKKNNNIIEYVVQHCIFCDDKRVVEREVEHYGH